MKLLEIRFENFRQFYGNQSIEFSKDDKNITIIFGENGKGKTGVFRGLIFALYGSKHLPQDDSKNDLHLVNFKMLKENLNKPVTTSVSVTFEHKNKKYIIKRSLLGYQTHEAIREKDNGVELNLIDENGNFSAEPIVDEDKVRAIINEILDEKIKDFFLFDAEKIDTLAKTDSKVKEEVKTGIIKLLQIDKLDRAINIIKNLNSKENRRITNESRNLGLKQKEAEIKALEDQSTNQSSEIDIYRAELEGCLKEIRDTEAKLKEDEDLGKFLNNIKNLKQQINTKKETLSARKNGLLKLMIPKAHSIFMKDAYSESQGYLNQIFLTQKDVVSIEVIDKILGEMKCICGTQLNDVPEALNEIRKLKNNYKRSEYTPFISLINASIDEYKQNEESMINDCDAELGNIRGIKEEINDLEKQVKVQDEGIKKYKNTEKNLNELRTKLSERQKDESRLKNNIARGELKLEELEADKEKAEKEYQRLLSNDASLRKDYERLEYITKLKDSFESLFRSYTDDMREKIMVEATKIFKQLIDKKDRNLLERININEKYEIELYNWSKTNITQDISQGQRQIVALSFITALAKVAAGNSHNIDFPLFMDTPFGRISGENRDNLIENIPRLTSQWILLLTDTEFAVTEEMRVKETGRLGKWYMLNQINVDHTEIEEVSLSDTMAKRG
jgi:DNA sulfur modification protein DndD